MSALGKHSIRLLLGAALSFWAGASLAATVVDVTLWDKGANTEMRTDMLYGSANLDMSMATMGIKLSSATAPAGAVTFNVTNSSTDVVHEMIVMQLADPGKPLPYIALETKVDEDKAGDQGEVSELEFGASGTLTVDLKAGKYLLICNVPGHFATGMWTEFEVTN
jgi:uncharacterized cupredoxin-like copper-binding protein